MQLTKNQSRAPLQEHVSQADGRKLFQGIQALGKSGLCSGHLTGETKARVVMAYSLDQFLVEPKYMGWIPALSKSFRSALVKGCKEKLRTCESKTVQG